MCRQYAETAEKSGYSIKEKLMETKLKLFNEKTVRTVWNADEEEWYFSVVDVCNILTDSADYQTARNYWKVLKNRLSAEGSELVTNCNRLKMQVGFMDCDG